MSFYKNFYKEKIFSKWTNGCRVNLNKLVYIGTRILLDLSKVSMQNFCYNFIKNKYDGKTKILLTNIDNLIYEIEVESVDNDSYKDK